MCDSAAEDLLIVPLGMYTLPEDVLTRQDGSKSPEGSPGVIPPPPPAPMRPFSRFIVGFRGGTSGGRGTVPSNKQPAMKKQQMKSDNTRKNGQVQR